MCLLGTVTYFTPPAGSGDLTGCLGGSHGLSGAPGCALALLILQPHQEHSGRQKAFPRPSGLGAAGFVYCTHRGFSEFLCPLSFSCLALLAWFVLLSMAQSIPLFPNSLIPCAWAGGCSPKELEHPPVGAEAGRRAGILGYPQSFEDAQSQQSSSCRREGPGQAHPELSLSTVSAGDSVTDELRMSQAWGTSES